MLYTKRKKRKHQVIRIIDTYRTNSNRREIDVSYQETSSAISSWRHCPGYHGAYITNREPSITALHEAVVRHATELSECPATRINRPSPRKKKSRRKNGEKLRFRAGVFARIRRVEEIAPVSRRTWPVENEEHESESNHVTRKRRERERKRKGASGASQVSVADGWLGCRVYEEEERCSWARHSARDGSEERNCRLL